MSGGALLTPPTLTTPLRLFPRDSLTQTGGQTDTAAIRREVDGIDGSPGTGVWRESGGGVGG